MPYHLGSQAARPPVNIRTPLSFDQQVLLTAVLVTRQHLMQLNATLLKTIDCHYCCMHSTVASRESHECKLHITKAGAGLSIACTPFDFAQSATSNPQLRSRAWWRPLVPYLVAGVGHECCCTVITQATKALCFLSTSGIMAAGACATIATSYCTGVSDVW